MFSVRFGLDISVPVYEFCFVSYTNLEIWKIAKKQSLEIHKMTLLLPKFEMYEEGSQIRRSAKSVGANIVEGYGRKRYKQDHIRLLTYAIASNDETVYHLETLYETHSLTDETSFRRLHDQATLLGKMLNRFIQSIESS